MSSGPGNILIRIGAETASAVRGIGNVDKALGDSMTKGQKATAALGKAALPAAAALGAIGVAAVSATKAAMEDAAAQDLLAGQLKRTAGATDAQVAAAENYITAMSRQTGIADDELRPALGKLATATGSMATAQKDLQLAMDVSTQTGKSLDSVTTALAKGYAGQTASIGKLVPGMDQAVIKSKDMHKVTQELADLTGGAAADAAETSAGQYKVFTNQMNELQETMGAALIPVVQALMPLLQRAADFVSQNAKAVQILIGVVAALAAGILVANGVLKAYQAAQVLVKVATAAWTAAQWLLNAALDANPIGIVILAIAALVTGIVIAYTKSETFRNIVTAAFNAVKAAVAAVGSAFQSMWATAQTVFNWIVGHWKVALFAFGPIGAAVALIANNFDTLKDAAASAFNAITNAIGAVSGAISGLIGMVESLIRALGRIHVPSIHIPNPFGLAMPEAALAGGLGRSTRTGAGATAGAGGLTINVYGAVDPEGTARQINRLLYQHARRQGRA